MARNDKNLPGFCLLCNFPLIVCDCDIVSVYGKNGREGKKKEALSLYLAGKRIEYIIAKVGINKTEMKQVLENPEEYK